MRRRKFLGATLVGSLGATSVFGKERPASEEKTETATTTPTEQAPRTQTQPTTATDSGSQTTASQPPLSEVTVGRRDITVVLPADAAVTQLSLVYDGTVVSRHHVWADQREVSIDLYGGDLAYPDTYRHAGYLPGAYTLVAYEDRKRVGAVDLHLVHGLAIDAVTVESMQVDGGPTIPHLVYALTNTGSGPTYVHELYYRDGTDTTAVIENPDAGGDLFAEADQEIHVLPATRRSPASPPIRHIADDRTGDARYLAPGETRRYLGPPVGGTYHDTDDPSTLEMHPESLSPSVTVECVSGNTGPQAPSATAAERERFAALATERLDAVTIAEYALNLSARRPTVTDTWGFYADVAVTSLERTGDWRCATGGAEKDR